MTRVAEAEDCACERAADEVELLLMGEDIDDDDRIVVLAEALCRQLANQEIIPDRRFFRAITERVVCILTMEPEPANDE